MDQFNEQLRRLANLLTYETPIADIRTRFADLSEDEFFLLYQAAKMYVEKEA